MSGYAEALRFIVRVAFSLYIIILLLNFIPLGRRLMAWKQD